MTKNRLQQLHDAGQSVWLDFIDRAMLRNGELARRIADDALMGMTSNPTIFEKALAEGKDYDAQIAAAADGEHTPLQLFEAIETDDVRTACDIFRPVYDQTKGGDGYVSIEVSPGVADDVDATLEEARRLWATVGRPNLMVKVPGTLEGARAVRRLTADGINVNITLLFSIDAHRRVIEAYFEGLEDRVRAQQPIAGIASVASFFVSRVDSEIDKRLDMIAEESTGERREHVLSLKGRAAIANAKLAYRLFQTAHAGARWERLAAAGARVQRPLWASTSTKNPAYRDVMYVEQLIGPDTINTMPPATIEAFRDHGEVHRTVDVGLDDAERVLSSIEQLGISFKGVTNKLLEDGLASFQKSFDSLLAGLATKTRELGGALPASR